MVFSIIDVIKNRIVLLISFDGKQGHILSLFFEQNLHFYSKPCYLMHKRNM